MNALRQPPQPAAVEPQRGPKRSGIAARLKSISGERYFTLALLLFIAGFVVFPTTKSLNNFYYVFIAVPALVCLVRGTWRRPPPDPILIAWAVFFALFAVLGALQGAGKFLGNLLAAAVFLATLRSLVSVEVMRDGRVARALFWMLALYVLAVAVYYSAIGRYPFGARVLEFPGRLRGPIFASMWLACLFGLAVPAWIEGKRIGEAVLGFVAVAFGIGFVLQSRSGLVGIAILALIGLVYLLRERKPATLAIAVLVLGALAAGLSLFAHNEVLASLIARGDSYRLELWREYYARWTTCGVWFGCGAGAVENVRLPSGIEIMHAHNLYLGLLLQGGVVTLTIFALTIAATLVSAWRARDPWGLYLALSLLMLNFDGSRLINNPNEIWLLVLLPAGLIAAGYRRSSWSMFRPVGSHRSHSRSSA